MYKIAIVGATGAVGEEILNVLDEFNFPIKDLLLLASVKSAGNNIKFKDKYYKVLELKEDSFEKNPVDIAFFSAGGEISARFVPLATKSKALVIDNTSYFRMDENVPLVVPECNFDDIKDWAKRGIIANPNCSTIQMIHVLKPLDDIFDLKRVDISTYQAASGAGKKGMDELIEGLKSFFAFKLDNFKAKVFPYTLALNAIPHIDSFCDNNYTKEEMKMINETQKILHKKLEISATCVRVGVLRSHSESLTLRFNKEININQAVDVLKNAPNVIVLDDKNNKTYPMPLYTSNTNQTYVGRIRQDINQKNILHLWCVADQIRVGAATNAVRIALKWIQSNKPRF